MGGGSTKDKRCKAHVIHKTSFGRSIKEWKREMNKEMMLKRRKKFATLSIFCLGVKPMEIYGF